jgi:hypothetical protein
MQAAAVTASNLATWLAAGQLRERKHAHAGRQARVSVSEIECFAGLEHSVNLSVIKEDQRSCPALPQWRPPPATMLSQVTTLGALGAWGTGS